MSKHAPHHTADQTTEAVAPPPEDYFAVLGLARRYDLTDAEIMTAYRKKARDTHPDRFAGASAETIADATRLSAAVNEAHRTLRDPVARAAYLLVMHGGPGPNEVRDVPGNLLAEVMMMREEIDSDKAANRQEALERHRTTLVRRRSETLETVAAAAAKLDTASEEEKKALRIALNAIKYYDNLLEQLAQDPLRDGPT